MARASTRPELRSLALSDPPDAWGELGFAVDGEQLALGGVGVTLGMPGRGIVGWSVSHLEAEVDGLPQLTPAAPRRSGAHPNGALGIDHVVVLTPDFDRTAAALDAAGMRLRRVVQRPDGARMGFRRLGPAILELVEDIAGGDGPARFWGLVVIVADLDGLAERLGEHLGPIRPAVQPGRRIAPVRESAGLGQKLAFMDPEPTR